MRATDPIVKPNGVSIHYLISGERKMAVASVFGRSFYKPARAEAGLVLDHYDEDEFSLYAIKAIADTIIQGQ